MEMDAVTFRTLCSRLLPPGRKLSPEQAGAVIQVAQIAVGVDLDEDPFELRLARQLMHHVAALANIQVESVPRVSPLPGDREERLAWINRHVRVLRSAGVGELAYLVAYLVAIGDLQLAPVESAFVEELRSALEISRDQAADLVVMVSSMLTPGVAASPTAHERAPRGPKS